MKMVRAIARLTPFQILHKVRKEIFFQSMKSFPRPFALPGEKKISALPIGKLICALDNSPFYPGWQDKEIGNTYREDLPNQRALLLKEANAVLERQFEILGFPPFRFEGEIDWKADPFEDPQWTIALNWCKHFVLFGKAYKISGDLRYAEEFCAQFESWIKNNPYGSPLAWTAQLVSLRIQAWIWAYFCFKEAEVFDLKRKSRFLRALWAQIDYLSRHLEFDVSANHLLSGAAMLVQCGILFPEFRKADHWLRLGRKVLNREFPKQVYPDGVSAEQSTYYHVLVGQMLFETIEIAKVRNFEVPPAWRETLSKMADFTLFSTKPNGMIPLLSDSMALNDLKFTPTDFLAAASYSLERSDLPMAESEKLLWIAGSEKWEKMGRSWQPSSPHRVFPSGGYAVARSGWEKDDDYLIFDCGPFGLRSNPGHGHADALAVEIQLGGKDVVIDAGPGSYRGDVFRRFFRGTAGHNTVTVDGEDQSEIWGAFRVGRTAKSRFLRTFFDDSLAYFAGEHDGYKPLKHRRYVLFRKGGYILIVDHLRDAVPHECVLRWHFAPGELQKEEEKFIFEKKVFLQIEGANSLRSAFGESEPPEGWLSFDLGHRVAAPEVIATAKGSDIWFASLFTTDPELSLVEGSPGRYSIGDEVIDFETDGGFEINGRPCGTQGENF